jgi:hypothetical protein
MAVLSPVLGGAAEDAEEHRQAELDGALYRVRAAAGAEPDLQRLLGPRDDERVLERPTPVRSVPRDPLVAVEREQQFELGGEQHVVVPLVEVKDRERDG